MRLRPSKPLSLVATRAWTWSLVLIVPMPVLLSLICLLGVRLVEPFSESLIEMRARTWSPILTQIMLTRTRMLLIHPLITSPNVMRNRSYNLGANELRRCQVNFDPIIICFNQIDARICNVVQQSSTIAEGSYSFFLFSFFFSLAVPISDSKIMHLTRASSTNCSVSAAVARPSHTIINVRCQAVFTSSNFFQKLKEVCDNLKFEFM